MNSSLVLETTAYTIEQLIDVKQIQIALAGRSNVGKSSLINALANRKNLAKISSTPGKTRSVNYYRVEPDNFYLVDLPGYGYARCSQEEREKWALLLEHYILSCGQLKALALLLDCRLPPQKSDMELAAFAQSHAIPLIAILTKADKCTQRERNEKKQVWMNLLRGVEPIITSSQKRIGLNDLWNALRLFAAGK